MYGGRLFISILVVTAVVKSLSPDENSVYVDLRMVTIVDASDF